MIFCNTYVGRAKDEKRNNCEDFALETLVGKKNKKRKKSNLGASDGIAPLSYHSYHLSNAYLLCMWVFFVGTILANLRESPWLSSHARKIPW